MWFDDILNNATAVNAPFGKNWVQNTDGFDTMDANNIMLTNMVYQGGDDCIAIKPRSYNIFVQNVRTSHPHYLFFVADHAIDHLPRRKRHRDWQSRPIPRRLKRDQRPGKRRTDPHPQQRHGELGIHKNLGRGPGSSIFVRECRASSWWWMVSLFPPLLQSSLHPAGLDIRC
jgi:hypothetical protein